MESLSFFFQKHVGAVVSCFLCNFLSLTSHINGTINIQLFILTDKK